jgi:hypothetical protein
MVPLTVCVSATLAAIYITPEGVKPRPAPIPTRWQLQLVPRDLPPLPGSFYTTTWMRSYDPRMGGGWYETYRFGRDTLTTPGVVTINRTPPHPIDRPRGGGGFGGPQELQKDPNREVPLAVYGPLVEFEGQLQMVAVVDREPGDDYPGPVLRATAIETRKNVWYQAKSEHFSIGPARVEECRLEFADDPRVKDEGRVTVRYSIRMTDEQKGETGEFEVRFKLKVIPGLNQQGRRVGMSLPNGRAYNLYLRENGQAAIWGLSRPLGDLRPKPQRRPVPAPADLPNLTPHSDRE